MSIGVPIKLLHEVEKHWITCELKTGELFRGLLEQAEDTMNVRLSSVQVTHRDGKNSWLDQVYIRGSQIRFIIVPDMFKHSPMFKRVRAQAKGKNLAMMREKASKVRANLQIRIDQVMQSFKTKINAGNPQK